MAVHQRSNSALTAGSFPRATPAAGEAPARTDTATAATTATVSRLRMMRSLIGEVRPYSGLAVLVGVHEELDRPGLVVEVRGDPLLVELHRFEVLPDPIVL